MSPVSSNTVRVQAEDPATYRLIELLFGYVTTTSGGTAPVPPPGDIYVYIAGPKLCSATPRDLAPSNESYLVGRASYIGDGVVAGSVSVDRDMVVTEAGLLLFGPGFTALLSKTCLTAAVNVTAGSIIHVEVRFVL